MEKMKGVTPKKVSPELVAGNKDVVEAARKTRKRGGKAMKDMGKMAGHKASGMRADRKARKSGGICSADWTAAQGEGQKPRG